MKQERGSETGPVRRVLSVKSGYIIAETHEGEIIKLPGEVRSEEERSIPKGTIESLFPTIQRALFNFPDLTPPEPTYWDKLKEKARYSEEDAVNLLRRHSNSVEDTTTEVLNRMLKLSGRDPRQMHEGALQTVYDFLEDEIHQLYIETTEVRLQRK